MTEVDTWERNGCIVRIFYDEDCESPRDYDGNFTFLGFPHRNYKIGDETIDPSDPLPCPVCEGEGEVFRTDEETGHEYARHECLECEGEGEGYLHNLEELMAGLTIKYQARVIRPVGMLDHSGVMFYLGGGPHWSDSAGWDSGTCGVILATEKAMSERWGEKWKDDYPSDPSAEGWATSPYNEAFIVECMKAEIDEYSKWANGECYGYTITRDGEEIDACWGFIGHDAVEEAANEAADAQDPPTKETP